MRYPSVLERYVMAVIALLAVCCSCGCAPADKPPAMVVTEWAMICMRDDQPTVRTSDESCTTAPNRFHWLYVFQNDPGYQGCPAVGQQLVIKEPDDGWITSLERPPGQKVIGLVPFNGGVGVAPPNWVVSS